jgi:hypothetical protein
MAAIAARADDSAQSVRIAYNAKQILFFFRTIWTSTMIIWCLGSHDRLRLVVIRFLRSSLMPLKVGKEAGSPAFVGTRFIILGDRRIGRTPDSGQSWIGQAC